MITKDEATEALLRSGYLLESRIESVLRRKGIWVETNSVYPDRKTGESRETDVSALMLEHVGPREDEFLFVSLTIECVNNPEPLVLITKRPIESTLHLDDVKVSGIPVKIRTVLDGHPHWARLADFFKFNHFHRYCLGRIATQYCSFQKKKQPPQNWMAWHEESHFDAFRKLCAAVDHDVDDHMGRWSFGRARERLNLQLHYPVLIVQGQLLEARPSAGSVRLFARGHLALRRSEFVKGHQRTYQVDVVQERHFGKFLNLITNETKELADRMRRRQSDLRRSMDAIVRMGRSAKSPESIRKAIDFGV